VPVGHYENLYHLPTVPGHAVHDLVREVAIAIRQTYGCQGVSTLQHNEPAGNQNAWHYHVHVFPRYNIAMAISLVASTGGLALMPAYANNLLPSSVVSRSLEGKPPTIEVAVGYSKSKTSPILKVFLSRLEELAQQKQEH
jgi:DNA-binding transcriptional LysR family regulator